MNFYKRLKKGCFPILFVLTAAVVCLGGCAKKNGDLKPDDEELLQQNTLITAPTKTADEYTAEENLFAVAGKMHGLDFSAETVGTVVSKVAFINYEQKMTDVKIRSGDEIFFEARSTSALVKVGLRGLMKGGRVATQKAENVSKDVWAEEITANAKAEYLQTYGVDPTWLTNYVLNEDTVLSGELVSKENGVYVCRYEIDPVLGTAAYRIRMREFGGLNGLPEFTSCTLEIAFNDEWIPSYIQSEDTYTVNLLGEKECVSKMKQTFSSVGGNVEISGAEAFRKVIK